MDIGTIIEEGDRKIEVPEQRPAQVPAPAAPAPAKREKEDA